MNSQRGTSQTDPRTRELVALGQLDERWDIYYHAFLLHTCLHSQCYWYKRTWWFPDPGRNERTLHMFMPSRFPPVENIKYYNMHLPNGKILENMMFRYIGRDNPRDAWLEGYVGYNLNLVTFDMTLLPPQGGQNQE
ncbi:hypothetical protein IAU59_006643 [Kwoniella sp. CBS 9459]